MAYIYGRSSDGDNADNGSTWALAKADLAGTAAVAVAADSVALASTHSETTASSPTLTFAGTAAAPINILSVSDAAAPPTTLSAGAAVAVSSGDILINGHVYVYGVTFSGTAATAAQVIRCNQSGASWQKYDTCKFRIDGTNAASKVEGNTDSNYTGSQLEWQDCTVRFGATTQGVQMRSTNFRWNGGGLESGGTNPSVLFENIGSAGSSRSSNCIIENLDLSAMGATVNLIGTLAGASDVTFRNCRMPTSWSGSLVSGTHERGAVARLVNCSSTDTNYELWEQYYNGSVKHETTIVRTGGASDGTTGISLKMATTANSSYPFATLDSPEIPRWNETTGSGITVTVEIVHDSLTALNNDEVWLEVNYLATSGYPQGDVIDDKRALLSSAAAQTASSETWTTTGLTNPNKRALAVTFTPQEKGVIYARVRLAKPSTTIYVCPKLELS